MVNVVAIATIRRAPIQSGECRPTAGLLSSEKTAAYVRDYVCVCMKGGGDPIAATLRVKIFYSTVSVTWCAVLYWPTAVA